MTPLKLEILLHHYYSAEPWPGQIFPAHLEAFEYFFENDLLSGLVGAIAQAEITDKGKFYIRAVLDLPLPEQIWIIPKSTPQQGN